MMKILLAVLALIVTALIGGVRIVRLWQISLQKSGTTGHRGWRELLELAACYPLPNKGMF